MRLFVKRDDVMGVGGGGNKLRKLEFLIGEALAQGCDTFITTGGIQSNHARLSAAAAARAGLACELVLTNMVPRDDEDYQRNGNVLLDGLFGAKVHALPRDSDPLAFAQRRAAELGAQGRKAYVVGAGGSSPVGCLGYADCAREIAEQEAALSFTFSRIVHTQWQFGHPCRSCRGLRSAWPVTGAGPLVLSAGDRSRRRAQRRSKRRARPWLCSTPRPLSEPTGSMSPTASAVMAMASLRPG